MIGIYLKERRRDFLDFVSRNPIEFQEIFDITNTKFISSFDKIFVDDPNLTGSSNFVYMGNNAIEEIFSIYVLPKIEKEVLPPERFYNAVLFYFERVYASCSQIVIPPVAEHTVDKPRIQAPVFSVTEAHRPEPIMIADESEKTDVFAQTNLSNNEQIAYMNGFSLVADNQSLIQQRPAKVQYNSGVKMRRKGSAPTKRVGTPIHIFSSLTDKAGTTTVAFLLAKALVCQNPDLRVIYLDLNISNPNTIAGLLNFVDNEGASIINIVTATEIDFSANLSLLTTTIAVENSSFSMITFGDATFRQKTTLSTIDYTQFLNILADNFDVVLVDIGKLQGTLPYQQILMQTTNANHILVADGSSIRAVNSFIASTRDLMFNYEIVVNKSVPAVGTFLFDKNLHVSPLAVIGQHNNTIRFITDAMQFNGTAIQNDLFKLGGAL